MRSTPLVCSALGKLRASLESRCACIHVCARVSIRTRACSSACACICARADVFHLLASFVGYTLTVTPLVGLAPKRSSLSSGCKGWLLFTPWRDAFWIDNVYFWLASAKEEVRSAGLCCSAMCQVRLLLTLCGSSVPAEKSTISNSSLRGYRGEKKCEEERHWAWVKSALCTSKSRISKSRISNQQCPPLIHFRHQVNQSMHVSMGTATVSWRSINGLSRNLLTHVSMYLSIHLSMHIWIHPAPHKQHIFQYIYRYISWLSLYGFCKVCPWVHQMTMNTSVITSINTSAIHPSTYLSTNLSTHHPIVSQCVFQDLSMSPSNNWQHICETLMIISSRSYPAIH